MFRNPVFKTFQPVLKSGTPEVAPIFPTLNEAITFPNAADWNISKPFVSPEIKPATKASIEDVKLLDIKIGHPVLHFNTITQISDQTIINYAFARYRGDLNKFEINLHPEK